MIPPGARLRIGDADRERAMADLALHYTDGRLDHEEYDERLDAVWTARTQADLAVLFNDLPRPPSTAGAARPVRSPAPRRRVPLLPILAVLILVGALAHQPFWLLIFPLMYVTSRRRHGGQPHGHERWRRSGRAAGW